MAGVRASTETMDPTIGLLLIAIGFAVWILLIRPAVAALQTTFLLDEGPLLGDS
jgi:hypothetical protein